MPVTILKRGGPRLADEFVSEVQLLTANTPSTSSTSGASSQEREVRHTRRHLDGAKRAALGLQQAPQVRRTCAAGGAGHLGQLLVLPQGGWAHVAATTTAVSAVPGYDEPTATAWQECLTVVGRRTALVGLPVRPFQKPAQDRRWSFGNGVHSVSKALSCWRTWTWNAHGQ